MADPYCGVRDSMSKAAGEVEFAASPAQPLITRWLPTGRPTAGLETVPNGTFCARSGLAWTPVSQARNRYMRELQLIVPRLFVAFC
jgi:hypothetical protein